MMEVLLEPTKFFEKAKERPPRPWISYLVVLLAGLISALASQLAARDLPAPTLFGPSWLWLLVGVLIGSLILWGIFGFLLHLLTGLGARAYEIAGWTFAPGVVLGLVLLALAALFPIEARLPPPPPPLEIAQLKDWMHGYEAAVRASLFSQVSRWLNLIGVLWGAWILYAGVRVFAAKRATLVVSLYLAIQAALYLLSFFGR